MELDRSHSMEAPPRQARIAAWACGLSLLALLFLQGWMTLALFGCEKPWTRLLDDQPILDGKHPLHLYHGFLGAQALRERGSVSCYDPSFQAGYLKTPIFDSGSRPAELCLALARSGYHPGPYKVGLAICCLSTPILLAAAAWGLGLGAAGVVLTVALGQIVFWSAPGQSLLRDGDVDLLLAALAGVAQAGMLARYHREARLSAWFGVACFSALGWFAKPLFFVGLAPVVLVYYLSVGRKHVLVWHVGLVVALLTGLAANLFWLMDVVEYWWIRVPLHGNTNVLPHRTLHTIWSAPVWGDNADRLLAAALVLTAIAGAWIFNETEERVPARLLGMGGAGCLLLVVGGLIWEPLGRLGTSCLVAPGLWYAVPLTVRAMLEGWSLAHGLMPTPRRGRLLAGGVVASFVLLLHQPLEAFVQRFREPKPFEIGLGSERLAVVDELIKHTAPDMRILWENGCTAQAPSRWPALLPLLTRRSYIGGLDPDACIEHGYAAFTEQTLAGRPLSGWSDFELEEFCRRYNIGWVACWSRPVVERFRAWRKDDAPIHLGGERWLIRAPASSFALRGQARLVAADGNRIALADVVPEDGKVVLSMHYQTGFRVSPNRVRIEREPDANDPIPFMRLVLPGPVERVVLIWSGD